MNKFFKIIAMVGIIFVGLSLSPVAKAAPPTLSFQTSQTTVAVGDTITVNVLMNAQGESVTATELRVSFPGTILQAQSITAGSFLPVVLTAGAVGSGTASIILGSQPTTPATGTGTLATIVFQVLAVGSPSISFDATTQVAVIGQTQNYVGAMTPLSLTVSAPTPAPTISSFTASPASITSVLSSTLSWVTTGATSLSINQGIGTVTGTSRSVSPTTTTTYTLTATNSGGSTTQSVTVTVTSAPDTTPPTVSITAPTAGSTVSGSATAVTATASDAVGVVGVQFRLDGVNLGAEDTSSPYSTTWNTTTASNGAHILTAVARDAAGNTNISSSVSVTVNNATTDINPPSTPTNLGATTVSSSQINLSWTASTDDVAVTGYRIYRCQGTSCTANVEVGTSGTTSYSNTGLSSATAYTYRVRAYDATGNLSSYSSSASATTQSVGDIIAPTVSVTAPLPNTTVSGTVTLSASASDNVGIASVQFRVDNVNVGSPDTTAPYSIQWDSSSVENGLRTIRAVARDAAGNETISSSIFVTVATPTSDDTTNPFIPTNLSSSNITSTSATISWLASFDPIVPNEVTSGVTGYKIYRGTVQIATISSGLSYTDTSLSPSTSYSYSVSAFDVAGNTSDQSSYLHIVTLAAPVTTTPASVVGGGGGGGGGGTVTSTITSSSAIPANNQITLTWVNPNDSSFLRTVVVKKQGSAPASSLDGTRIYEGTTTSFVDTALTNGLVYYYGLFPVFTSGIASSPARVMSAIPQASLGSAQINTGQTNTSTTTTSPIQVSLAPKLSLSRTLYVGMTGTDIKLLQSHLISLGYLSAGNNTGYFGNLTRLAVQKYQCAKGLVCTGTESTTGYGMVGQKTRALFAGGTETSASTQTSVSTTATSLTRTIYIGAKGADVTALQNILISLGYLSAGNNTGYFGNLTRAAVQRYQCEKMQICSGNEGTTGYGLVGQKTRAILAK